MTARIMIRGCRRLSSSFFSKHSSPFSKLHHRQPPSSPSPPPPPPQPFTTHHFLQTKYSFLPPQLHPHIPTTPTSSTPPPLIRHFSSSSTTSSNTATPSNSGENMKHQEIEGPTVEKDLSPLANETRQVTNTLLKTMYNVSTFFALLGLSHLALGAYSYYTLTSTSPSASASTPTPTPTPTPTLSLMISIMAFGFPFSMAFMIRQSLKSMHFFNKMETIGRLQILTSTMQIFKNLRILFVRVRALSFLCLAGLSFSFLYSVSSSV